MKLFHRILFFSATYVISQRNDDEAFSPSQNWSAIFGYDFRTLPDLHNVLVWKVAQNQEISGPIQYYEDDYKLESGENYIIVSQKHKTVVMIYYRCNKHSTLENKIAVGQYATEMFFLVKSFRNCVIRISREIEDRESISLKDNLGPLDYKIFKERLHARIEKDIIEGKETMHLVDLYSIYIDVYFPLNRHNLYIVNGDERGSRIKKVPSNSKYMVNEHNCIVYESEDKEDSFYPARVWCGSKADNAVEQRAESMGKEFWKIYIRNCRKFSGLRILGNDTEQFKERLDGPPPFTSHRYSEIYNVDDFAEDPETFVRHRDAAVKVIEIYDDCTWEQIIKEPIKNGPIDSSYFNIQKNYIVDSGSSSGLFVFMGRVSSEKTSVNAVKYVEHYLVVNKFSSDTPVRIITYPEENIDFQIMLEDWPKTSD